MGNFWGLGLSAGAAVLFLLLRMMAVARWDWNTAFQIADVVDFGDSLAIAFGTLFAQPLYSGILIMGLLPLVVLRLIFPVRKRTLGFIPDAMLLAVLLACTVTLIRSYGEWWLPAGSAVIAALLIGARLSPRRSVLRRAATTLLRSIGGIAVAGALALAGLVSSPWTPLEQIETDQGTIQGYVIKVESGYLRVLTDDPREMIILMGDDVISRT